MPAIKQDSQGTVIRAGQKVAYNRSGDVVPGEVVAVLNSHIKIRCEDDRFQGYPKISKVKRGMSVLVLVQPTPDFPSEDFLLKLP